MWGGTYRCPLTKVSETPIVLDVYGFRDYVLPHHKRIEDTHRTTYEI